MTDLSGHIVLVTGASKDIGQASAVAAARGWGQHRCALPPEPRRRRSDARGAREARTPRVSFVSSLLGIIALQLIVLPALAAGIAEGADLGWTMIVADDWYGGNFDQIGKLIQQVQLRGESTDSPYFQTLLALRETTRNFDAYLIKIEPTLKVRATTVEVTVMEPSLTAPINQMGYDEFLTFHERLIRSHNPSATVARRTRTLTIGGWPARAMEFRLQDSDRVATRLALYAVITPQFVHLFKLSTQESVAAARISAFEGMLLSLRYK